MAKEVKLKKYEDVLMAALKFDEGDLEANRAGGYSKPQQRQLRRLRASHALAIAVLLMGTAVITLPIAVSVDPSGAALLLIFTGLFLFAALAFAAARIFGFSGDLRDGVRVTEGRVQLDTTGGDASEFFVKLDSLKFKVKKAVFLAFKNGDPYRVYYTPHSKSILAAEWLRGDDPFTDAPADQRQRETASGEEAPDWMRQMLDDESELREDSQS